MLLNGQGFTGAPAWVFAAVYPRRCLRPFRRRGRSVWAHYRWRPALISGLLAATLQRHPGLPVAPNAAYARSLCLRISLLPFAISSAGGLDTPAISVWAGRIGAGLP